MKKLVIMGLCILLCISACKKDDEKQIVAEPTNITLNINELTIAVGDSFTFSANVLPSETIDKSIVWKVDDEDIAFVDNKGVFTALKIGATKLTATTKNNKAASCVVNISEKKILISSISFNDSELKVVLGETKIVTSTIVPSNATDKALNWSSSHESVATVSNGIITGLKLGKTNIVATSSNGVTASCSLEVIQPVESISLTEICNVKKGQSLKLSPTIVPSNAQFSRIIWTSSNNKIATVDDEGKLSAIMVGSVSISALVDGTKKEASCIVNVTPRGNIIAGLVGKWHAIYCTTVWGDKEFSEEELFDYSGGNPNIEEKFAMHKKMYSFTLTDDDKVSLDFIARNQNESVHFEASLLKKNDYTFSASFPSENPNVKTVDFQYVFNKYMNVYEIMISLPSEYAEGIAEERIYFQK